MHVAVITIVGKLIISGMMASLAVAVAVLGTVYMLKRAAHLSRVRRSEYPTSPNYVSNSSLESDT